MTSGPSTDSFCLTHTPTVFQPGESDKPDAATQRKILKDDRFGAKHCGWRP